MPSLFLLYFFISLFFYLEIEMSFYLLPKKRTSNELESESKKGKEGKEGKESKEYKKQIKEENKENKENMNRNNECEGGVNCSNIFTEECIDCHKIYCEDCIYSFAMHKRCMRCMELFCNTSFKGVIEDVFGNYLCGNCFKKEEKGKKEKKEDVRDIKYINNDKNCHYITPLVAIGNRNTSYEKFDIIINLNYPYNNAQHHCISINMFCDTDEEEGEMREMIEELEKNGETEENEIKYRDKFYKSIYNVGMNDHPSEADFLEKDLLPFLLTELDKKKHHNRKILFHCYAGVSRSATVAMAYLKKTLYHEMPLLNVFHLVRKKREIVCPNYTFIQVLTCYFKDTSIIEHSFDMETMMKMRNEEMIKQFLLLSEKETVNMNGTTKYYGTFLELACQLDLSYETISLFLERGANPRNGYPLHLYLLHSHDPSIRVIDLLVSYGCDINKRDTSNFTPLFHAKHRELDHSIIEMMMNRGAYLYQP